MILLNEEFYKLAGEPGFYDKGLQQREEMALARESAMRTWQSILISRNEEVLVKKQKERMCLWWEAIKDLRTWISRGKRIRRIMRKTVSCNDRVNELWVRLPREVREGIEVITEDQKRTVIEPEKVQIKEDREILSSERRLLKCEESFRRWDRKLLKKEEELIKRRFWDERKDERMATEQASQLQRLAVISTICAANIAM